MKINHLKASILLFGTYSFAVSVANLFHEFGHALYIWSAGGNVWYDINPFGTVFGVVQGDINLGASIYHWGGTLSATFLGILLLGLLWRRFNLYWAPVVMTGVVSVLFSGGNLLPGVLFDSSGDATRLMDLGTPRWIILCVALILLLLGLWLAARWLVPLTGLHADEGWNKYLIVFLLGFGPYTLIEVVYSILKQSGWQRALFFALLTNLVVVMIALAGKWYTMKVASNTRRIVTLEWRHVLSSVFAGILSILFFIFVI